MRKLDLQRLDEALSFRICKGMAENDFLGLSVILRQNGEKIYEKNFGFCDVEKTKPMEFSSLFRIASMTKPVTAVAVLMLAERGLIDLNAPVEQYLEEFKGLRRGTLDENGVPVALGELNCKPTVTHLLTHSALLDFGRLFDVQFERMPRSTRNDFWQSLLFCSDFLVEEDAGSHHAYSPTFAFDLLAAIIERVCGRPYETFMTEEIFSPLGMKNTTFSPTDPQWARMVNMHGKKDGKSILAVTYEGCVFEDYPPSHPLGGAGLASTAEDYDRFASMLLNGGEFDGRRYLNKETVKRMATIPFLGLGGSHHQWGLGVRVVENDQRTLPVGSFGWSGAYGSHFWVDPENQITAVFMRNSRYDGGGESLLNQNLERDVMSALE